MSPSTDRSKDPSPFAWIFGSALAFLALGGIARAIRDRRDNTPEAPPAARDDEDDTLSAHPS